MIDFAGGAPLFKMEEKMRHADRVGDDPVPVRQKRG
jgi:hypothetical protein